MKTMLTLGLAVAMLAAACAAYAYPTLIGPTGLVNAPTTQVAPAGQINAALDYYNSKDNGVTTNNSWPFRVLYGVGSGFEVGAAYDADAIAGKGLWDINAKYALPSYFGANFAVGALYGQANTDPENTKVTQVYLSAGKAFNVSEGVPTINTTIGVNWTQVKPLDSDQGWRLYLGAEATVAPKLSLLADFQTKSSNLEEAQNLWSAAARYAFTPALAAELGVTNGPIVGSDDSNLFLGVDYAFGGATEE